jgi:hypothetical protein
MSGRHVSRRYAGLVLLAALAVMQGWPVRADATTSDDGARRPLELVRASVARVQGFVRSETGPGSETRRAEIRTIAETLFEFEAMSRRMLARHWNDGTPTSKWNSFGHRVPTLQTRRPVGGVRRGPRRREPGGELPEPVRHRPPGPRRSPSFWNERGATSVRPGVAPRRPTPSGDGSCCFPS